MADRIGHQVRIEESTAKLAAAAAALNARGGDRAALSPFQLAYFTDERSRIDPEVVATVLPAGVGVIFRNYDAPDRPARANRLATICKERDLPLFIAGDEALARSIRADGVHWPSWRLMNAPARPGDLLCSAACHSASELQKADALAIDCAFLSPVFPTRSHPDADTLGAERLMSMAAAAAVPVLALGGVDAGNARSLAGEGVSGFGAIDAFVGD
ncbi:MAG: thiamine phosphate synthase [Pseudomonadota bacterium]